MTNEELFQDLKQFIEATVSQQVSASEQRLIKSMATKEDLLAVEERLGHRIDDLDTKLDTTQDAIGDGFTSMESSQQDHERRIRRLEQRVA
ncbi:hypothetical protein AB0425_23965 [Actinosynnema sp. NPDC051121]